MRADVGDIKPHSGVMVLFVHGKGRSGKDDFVVLTETLQADINRYLAERKDLSPTDPLFASTSNRNKGGRHRRGNSEDGASRRHLHDHDLRSPCNRVRHASEYRVSAYLDEML